MEDNHSMKMIVLAFVLGFAIVLTLGAQGKTPPVAHVAVQVTK